MRKTIAVVAVMLAAGVGLARAEPRAKALPAAAAALEADRTLALVGIEGLDAAMREAIAFTSTLPAAHRRKLGTWFFGPAQRRAKIGFDPAEAEGWEAMGLDPAAGLAIALDVRLSELAGTGPTPIIVARVSRARLVALLEERGIDVKFGEKKGASELVTVGELRILVGERAGFTLAVPAPLRLGDAGLAALRAAFDEVLRGKGSSLADDQVFRTALSEAVAQPRYYAYGALAPAVSLSAFAHPDAKALLSFYAERFKAMGASMGMKAGGGARLVAGPEGVEVLRRIAVPRGKSPAFSRYVSAEGRIAVRFSVNPAEFLEGVAALGAPLDPGLAGQLLAVKHMFPTVMGVSWDELAAAFSGHLVFTVPFEAMQVGGPDLPPDTLVLVGVADAAKADAVLAKVLEALKADDPALTVEPYALRGHRGHRVRLLGGEMYLVRVERVLLASSDPAFLGAALTLGDGSLRGTPAGAMLDGSAVLGFVVDFELVSKKARGTPAEAFVARLGERLAPGGQAVVGVEADDAGLRVSGGWAGALAAFAFVAITRDALSEN